MPLSELNGSIVPIYVDKCRPAESRTWIVVLLCNKSTFQGHVPYVMNNSGLLFLSESFLNFYGNLSSSTSRHPQLLRRYRSHKFPSDFHRPALRKLYKIAHRLLQIQRHPCCVSLELPQADYHLRPALLVLDMALAGL